MRRRGDRQRPAVSPYDSDDHRDSVSDDVCSVEVVLMRHQGELPTYCRICGETSGATHGDHLYSYRTCDACLEVLAEKEKEADRDKMSKLLNDVN